MWEDEKGEGGDGGGDDDDKGGGCGSRSGGGGGLVSGVCGLEIPLYKAPTFTPDQKPGVSE